MTNSSFSDPLTRFISSENAFFSVLEIIPPGGRAMHSAPPISCVQYPPRAESKAISSGVHLRRGAGMCDSKKLSKYTHAVCFSWRRLLSFQCQAKYTNHTYKMPRRFFASYLYNRDICSRPWSSSRRRAPAAGMLRTR